MSVVIVVIVVTIINPVMITIKVIKIGRMMKKNLPKVRFKKALIIGVELQAIIGDFTVHLCILLICIKHLCRKKIIEKNIKMNYAISVDNTHKDVSDFFKHYDENTTDLLGDGDSHID